MSKIIAIDFDGTLFEYSWPEIGRPYSSVIGKAIEEKANGAKLILWTNRIGEKLEEAVSACLAHGLEFDAVNENLPEMIEAFENDTRKVYADEYWDDRAVPVRDGCLIDAGKADEAISQIQHSASCQSSNCSDGCDINLACDILHSLPLSCGGTKWRGNK